MKNALLLFFLTLNYLGHAQDYENLVFELNQLSNRQLISIVKGDSLSSIKLELTKKFLLNLDDQSAVLLNDMSDIEFKRRTEAAIAHKLSLKEGETPYHYVARTADMSFLDLLQGTYPVNKGEGFKNKPIYQAIAIQNVYEIVKAFVDHGADIHSTDENGNNLLHISTMHSNIVLIDFFLTKGLSIDKHNDLGLAPVHLAAKIYYNEDIIKHILTKGGKIDTTNFTIQRDEYHKNFSTQYYTTIMHEAARNNWVDVLQKGIGQGIDIDLKIGKGENELGATPLLYATKEKSVDAITFLIANGVNPNAVTKWGNTPLLYAIKKEDKASFDALVTPDTNVNYGFPILEALKASDPHFAKTILLNGSYIAPNTPEGYDNHVAFSKLYEANSPTESYDAFMTNIAYSPLHISALRGWTEVCKLIRDQGTAIDLRSGKELNTALQEVVKRSLEHDYYNVVEALLKMGANPTTKNSNGKDSFDLAKENKDKKMVKLLKSK